MSVRTRRFCLSLGAALLVALAALLVARQWEARGALEAMKIAVAAADIRPGTRMRAELLQLAHWPAGSVPHGAYTTLAALEGRVTRAAFLRRAGVHCHAQDPQDLKPCFAILGAEILRLTR